MPFACMGPRRCTENLLTSRFNIMNSRQILGAQAEALAKTYLLQKGFTFVDQNVRFPEGEVDLVMLHAETLVLVEVKAAKISGAFPAWGHFNVAKQAKYRLFAKRYLNNPRYRAKDIRVDLICVSDNFQTVQHFENVI